MDHRVTIKSSGYVNWKLLVVLVLGVLVLAGTAVFLRQYQRRTQSSGALADGLKAYEAGEWDKAAKELGRYIGRHQNDLDAVLKYALAQTNRRPSKASNIKQAIASYRMILRADGTVVDAVKPLMQLYIRSGSPGEAKLVGERFLKKRDDLEVRRLLAQAESNLGQVDLAIKQLTDLVTEHPHEVLPYETLALLLEVKKNDVTSARYWLDQDVKKNPDSLQAKILLISHLLRQGQDQEVTKIMNDLGDLTGQDPGLTLRLAQFWLELGQPEKAKAIATDVEKTSPGELRLWDIKTRLALQKGDPNQMVEVARESRKALGDHFWDFLPEAMELFIRGGALDEVQHCVDQMDKAEYGPALSTFFKGWIAFKKQDYHEAVDDWQSAMGQGYKTIQARLLLASAYRRLNDQASALQTLQSLVVDYPNNPRSHLALAQQLAMMKHWPEAQQETMTVLQMQPQNNDALLIHAQASMHTTDPNQWSTVEQQLERLEQRDPNKVEVLWLRFQSALRQKKMDKAQQYLTKLKGTGQVSPLRLKLSRVSLMVAQEQWQQALSALKTLRSDYPDSLDVIQRMAAIYKLQNNQQDCEKVLKEAMDLLKNPQSVQTLGLQLVDYDLQWKRRKDAVSLLASLDKRCPDSISIKRRRLSLIQKDKIPAWAQTLVDEIKTLEGNNGWQWKFEQARLWFLGDHFKGNFTKLVRLLKENLVANPDDTSSRRLLAAAYEKNGQLRLALATYKEAADRNPNNLNILIPYVSALFHAQDFDKGNRILQRINAMKLENPMVQQLQVQGYLAQGKFQNAADVLEDLFNSGESDQKVGLSLALLKMSQKKYEEAGKILSVLATADPNSLPVMGVQVRLDMLRGKNDEALALCNNAIKRNPSSDTYILRGRMLTDANQVDQASKDYLHAIDLEPNNAEVWFSVYQFHQRTQQIKKALQDMNQILELAPENLQYQKAAITLFLSSTDEKRQQQGRGLLDQALQQAPKDVDLNLYKARLLMVEGTQPSLEQASQMVQKVLDDHPRHETGWVLLVQIYRAQKENGKALDAVGNGLSNVPDSQALLMLKADIEASRSPLLAVPTLRDLYKKDPNNGQVLVKLANTLIDAGRSREAMTLIKGRLAGAQGKFLTALQLSYARALYENGQKDEAVKRLTDMIGQTPKVPQAVILCAQLLSKDQRWDDALAILDKWNQVQGQDVDVSRQVAGIFLRSGQAKAKTKAEDLLHKLVDKYPQNAKVLAALGDMLLSSGDNQGAVSVYQRLLDVDPENVIAMNNLAWLLSTKLGRPQEALILANRGLKLQPTYADLLDTRASIYMALGKYDQAIADLHKCLGLYSVDNTAGVGSHFRLGKSLAKVGRRQEALDALNQALDLSNHLGAGLTPQQQEEAQTIKAQLLSGK